MFKFDLDEPIFTIGKASVPWTIGNSFEGLQIFGGIGSGKTSGSGRFFALKFLSKGYGGLVLTVKSDEKQDWIEYAKLTGRHHDLVIVEPNGEKYFNFLDYETTHSSKKSYSENILQVLKTVIKASEEKSTGKNNDPFWENALDMLISNTIDLCLLAYNKVSIEYLYDIARSASRPKKKENNHEKKGKEPAYITALDIVENGIRKAMKETEEEFGLNFVTDFDQKAFDDLFLKRIPHAREFTYIKEFFTETYAELSEKTKSIVDFSFTGFLYRLLKDPIYSLFCSNPSNFNPEDCLKGKIILINLPVKHYHKVGRDTQIMFKYIWQRAMERRNVKENNRPVFLWADEAQNFLHEYDAEYQATARSSRIATIYISQNMPNYYANMTGEQSQYKVKSFLGTLATKIFHANADIETNQYASTLIGEAYQPDHTEATSTVSGQVTVTKTVSSKLEKMVRPEKFNTLLTGGQKNEFKVTAILHAQGMALKDGFSYHALRFDQNYKP